MPAEIINYSNAGVVPTIYIDEKCDLPLTEFDFSDAYALAGVHRMTIASDPQMKKIIKTIEQGVNLIVDPDTLSFKIPSVENTLRPGTYYWQIKKISPSPIFLVLEGTIIVNAAA